MCHRHSICLVSKRDSPNCFNASLKNHQQIHPQHLLHVRCTIHEIHLLFRSQYLFDAHHEHVPDALLNTVSPSRKPSRRPTSWPTVTPFFGMSFILSKRSLIEQYVLKSYTASGTAYPSGKSFVVCHNTGQSGPTIYSQLSIQ